MRWPQQKHRQARPIPGTEAAHGLAGVTGGKKAAGAAVEAAMARIRRHTGLPIAVGFGIATPEDAGVVARVADAAVVGSAFVRIIAANLDGDGGPAPGIVGKVLDFAAELSAGVRGARVP